VALGCVRKLDLATSGCIADKTDTACFAVIARRKQRLPLSKTRLRQQPKTAKEKTLALGPTTEFSDQAWQ